MTATRGIEPFNILSDEQVGQIFAEAVQTLETIGVRVENKAAAGRLATAGTALSDDGKRALIPPDLVKKCIESAPGSFLLYSRGGDEVGSIGRGATIFDPGSAAISVYDFKERRIRKPLTSDVIDFVRLTDRLDAYGAQSTGVVPGDVAEQIADRYRLYLALLFGTKPIITGTFAKDAFPAMHEMLVAVRGDAKSLADKPLAIFDCCPTSPLTWDDVPCETLMQCAEHCIPAEIVSMPLAGATGPVTLAGSLVQVTAEALACLLMINLVVPKYPVIMGPWPFVSDLRTGAFTGGGGEEAIVSAAAGQIMNWYGLTSSVGAGMSDAKLPDNQAGYEKAIAVVLAAQAGTNNVSESAGMVGSLMGLSYESLVIDNDMLGAVLRTVRGIEVNDETLSVDVIRQAVAGEGHFLRQEQTLALMRTEYEYPSLADRRPPNDWVDGGSPDIRHQAGERVKEILSTHYPEYIHPDIDKKIREKFKIELPRDYMSAAGGRW